MSQGELVWGAFSLMVLGALVSMCMKCQQAGNKQKASFNNQRNQCESRSRLEVPQTHSTSQQKLARKPPRTPRPSKTNEHLSAANYCGAYNEPRYQNCGKEPQMEREETYVEPIPGYFYSNCQQSARPASEENSHIYQNLAQPASTSNGVSIDVDVYENAEEIQTWKHAKTDGKMRRFAAVINPVQENHYEDEGEPDYINAAISSRSPA
ncbi:linker for activation of T-cells family member 2-like [Varanus komodoensis]|uniref:linker for activation of T-cells family member 2-like n=1 Tax=Varanus komodoensis TaxID=61221 RepID=UPI001CF7D151|nr:linker for activation of T-cells family member 2-like [Varanus komodoensis]